MSEHPTAGEDAKQPKQRPFSMITTATMPFLQYLRVTVSKFEIRPFPEHHIQQTIESNLSQHSIEHQMHFVMGNDGKYQGKTKCIRKGGRWTPFHGIQTFQLMPISTQFITCLCKKKKGGLKSLPLTRFGCKHYEYRTE